MGRIALPARRGLVKPQPWDLSPGFVAPEGQWFWDHETQYAIPLWRGVGEPVDLSLRDETITRENGASWNEGVLGRQIDLDSASSQFLRHSDRTLGALLGRVTATFVFRTTDSSSKITLFGTFNDGFNTGIQIVLNSNSGDSLSSGRILCWIRDDNDAKLVGGVNSDTGFHDGEWHTLTFAWIGVSNDLQIFLDGVEQSVTLDSQQSPSNFAEFEYDGAIGARNVRSSFDQHFDGSLAMVSFRTEHEPERVSQQARDPFVVFQEVQTVRVSEVDVPTSPDDLQHGHTLEQVERRSATPDDLQHGHTLDEVESTPEVRITQDVVESVEETDEGSTPVRVTQDALEVTRETDEGDTPTRTTQDVVEVTESSDPDVRSTQFLLEIVRTVEEDDDPPRGFPESDCNIADPVDYGDCDVADPVDYGDCDVASPQEYDKVRIP